MVIYKVSKLIYGEKTLSEYVKLFYDKIYIAKRNHMGDFTLFYKGIKADWNVNDLFTGTIHVSYSI